MTLSTEPTQASESTQDGAPPTQNITFRQYRRMVLPLDGHVFWVATGTTQTLAATLNAATSAVQTAQETASPTALTLTINASDDLKPFTARAQGLLWVGTWQGQDFAISNASTSDLNAGSVLYSGQTITAPFAAQFVDDASQLDNKALLTSSCLPAFLAMPSQPTPLTKSCPWPEGVPVFPSFAVPDDQPTPYIAVCCRPKTLAPVSMAPSHDAASKTSSQIVREGVRLTLMGLDNQQACQVRDYVRQWALGHDSVLGVVNSPVIRDRPQKNPATATQAVRKTIDFTVMYPQRAMADIAMGLIKAAAATLTRASS
ncbi:hypothetical protein E3E12_08070 [Formicincola oecophyllae]|uniref:Uncharacterized protein n=1 Tax=Formicincola oecophyllae TaxID=2558361 RepID=A0A4Y6U9T7_9PROT|nr:hypothetical protein [Formicincola oecophyllae]QDH14152.1 hypothetical protein E3E12_08070 [Formicincola oecophyllae]